MKKDDCIFCKIAAGEIPTTVVYETDDVLAFEDANPMMPVHTLVIPKDHYENLADDVPEDVLGKVFAACAKVASIKNISQRGFRILSNSGDDACQMVHHLHVHVMGGDRMNDGSPSLD